MLTEREGCKLLRSHFETAGLSIIDDFSFDEEGVRVELDGFDPQRRVGYEYITTEAGDREEFTPQVIEALESRMVKGEISLLLIDETSCSPEMLANAAEGFLARLRSEGRL